MARACQDCVFWEPPPIQPESDKALPMESSRKISPDTWYLGECRFHTPTENYLVEMNGSGHVIASLFGRVGSWELRSQLRSLNRTRASYWCGKFTEKN